VCVRVRVCVCVCVCPLQVSHRQYMFLMHLQRSLKALQSTLQQDLEAMCSKRDRKDQRSSAPADPAPDPDHRAFGVCLGVLLQSAEVALLLQPVAQAEGSGSSVASELSPSESRGALGLGGGGERDGEAEAQGCSVDQLLCGGGGGAEGGASVLLPTVARPPADPHRRKASLEERTWARSHGRQSFDDGGGGGADGATGAEEQAADPLPDSSQDWAERDKATGAKIPQSVSRYTQSFTVLLGFTEFHRVLLGFTKFHRVLLGFTEFQSFTEFY